MTAKEVSDYEERVKDEVAKATREGMDSPDAAGENALTNVYGVDVPKAMAPAADVETEEMNMVAALRSALTEEMERDERVMVLGQDVGQKGGVFLVTDGLRKRFGEARVIDTPLAESSIAGVALGLALTGKRPVAEMQFADFAHMAFNQITNEIAKYRYRSDGDWSVPLVVRAPMGGHAHGALYHSQSIEARFATPGLKIVIPSSPYEAKGLLLAAIRDPDPVVFLEPTRIYRSGKAEVEDNGEALPLDIAFVLREGSDVTLISWGAMLKETLAAADQLDEEGIAAEVIDLATLKPYDEDTVLASVTKTGRCVIVHEAARTGGFGAELAALIAERALLSLMAPVKRVTGYDTIVPLPRLEQHYLPSVARIADAARQCVRFN